MNFWIIITRIRGTSVVKREILFLLIVNKLVYTWGSKLKYQHRNWVLGTNPAYSQYKLIKKAKCYELKLCIMNRKIKFIIPIFAAVFAIMFVFATPYVMAEMGEKKHGHMIEKINAYCDMSPEEQAEVIAKHKKSDEMVSKINEYCLLDEEGRQAKISEYKEKWSKYKSHYTDLTPEEREAKMAQFKEMKEAFSSISDEDRELIMTHFKEMKQEYATLSDEEKDAKHAEFKSKMEEFSALALDEKIVYLQEFAKSLR